MLSQMHQSGADKVAASVSEISTNTYFVSGNDDTGDKYQYYHAQHMIHF